MPPGVLLALAIAVEVGATICLRYSDGFTKPLPVGRSSSSATRSRSACSRWSCSDISVGTTYAIWAGAGTAAIAVIGIVALGEPATALQARRRSR